MEYKAKFEKTAVLNENKNETISTLKQENEMLLEENARLSQENNNLLRINRDMAELNKKYASK